eukprot:CAMPEP_0206491476 /NCGR_PEP_ID=MMETSP0324_2-20121206/45038_1 /ASSEMBLY_ACC=CAM_ASM_000836 /TAXON_ID=2866 /ORGANISM="Crypthecodinium cohnii, Strain Seligo" /LENGTH=97 /DNA_ID=CAMNT_0053972713 /DNA_START=118 /DNA_END=408 /DNA_ORIENTATION=+
MSHSAWERCDITGAHFSVDPHSQNRRSIHASLFILVMVRTSGDWSTEPLGLLQGSPCLPCFALSSSAWRSGGHGKNTDIATDTCDHKSVFPPPTALG